MKASAWILSLLLLAGCFRIRPVEPPGSASSAWVSPTDYSILLSNLRSSIAQRNVQHYLRCFAPGFRFEPVPRLFNENESLWRSWSLLDEQGWLENAFADLSTPSGNSLILEELALQDVSADSLTYIGNYLLRIQHADTSLSTLFQGQAQLRIRLNAFNEWEISRFADIETHPDSSWSQLKLAYSQ